MGLLCSIFLLFSPNLQFFSSAVALPNMSTPQMTITEDAFDLFMEAREASFSTGSVQLNGRSVVTDIDSTMQYQINGHHHAKSETLIIFTQKNKTSTEFLLTNGVIYAPAGDCEWDEQSLGSVLAKLTAMGVLDQFFMLELLYGERADLYKSYMTLGTEENGNYTIQIKLSKSEYLDLFEAWTADLHGLLGVAAEGMSELEGQILQGIVRKILSSLEAEACYVFFVEPETMCIVKVEIEMKSAAPDMRPGAGERHSRGMIIFSKW